VAVDYGVDGGEHGHFCGVLFGEDLGAGAGGDAFYDLIDFLDGLV